MGFVKRFMKRLRYVGASRRGELMWCCSTADVDRAKEILEIIDNVNYIDDEDIETPLTMAIKRESQDMVQLLIDKGADLNFKNKNGDSPVKYAIKYQNYNILNMLLDNGADTEIKDNTGKTPLIYLLATSKLNTNKIKMIKSLVKHNAKINNVDNEGKTALMWACTMQMQKTIDMANNRIRLKKVRENRENLIKYLIKNGANINKEDKNGKTALMLTVDNTEIETTIRLLLKNSGYAKYANKACMGVNIRNYDIEEKELRYIKNSEWHKWQRLRKEQLDKTIKTIKNAENMDDLKEYLEEEYNNMNEKVSLWYEQIKELISSEIDKNKSQIIKVFMRISRGMDTIRRMETIKANVEANKEIVIMKLEKELEETKDMLTAIKRLESRVELGVKKEILDVISLSKANGVKIKDIRNYGAPKEKVNIVKKGIKNIKHSMIDFF